MGNVTSSLDPVTVFGNKVARLGVLTLSSSYASNGDAITWNTLFGMYVEHVFPTISGGYHFEADLTNNKLIVYEGGSPQSLQSFFLDSEEIQQIYFGAGDLVADEVLSWIPQFDGEITAFDIEYGSIGVAGRTIIDLEIDGTTALDDEIESAPAVVVTETITYANGSPNTATRASGSFIDDGLKVGDVVAITGSANNNVTVTITVLTATVLSHTDTAWGTEEADTNDTTFTVAAITGLVRSGAIASGAKQFTNGQEITIDVDQIAAGTTGTDLSATITVKRYVGVKTSVIEFVAPFTGVVKNVVLEVGVGGSGGGGTTIDVNINGTSIFTTEPVVAHDAADGAQDTGTIDVANDDMTVGDTISIDIDAVPTNKDSEQISINIEFEKTSTASGQPDSGDDLSSVSVSVLAIGRRS